MANEVYESNVFFISGIVGLLSVVLIGSYFSIGTPLWVVLVTIPVIVILGVVITKRDKKKNG